MAVILKITATTIIAKLTANNLTAMAGINNNSKEMEATTEMGSSRDPRKIMKTKSINKLYLLLKSKAAGVLALMLLSRLLSWTLTVVPIAIASLTMKLMKNMFAYATRSFNRRERHLTVSSIEF